MGWGVAEKEFLLGNSRVLTRLLLLAVASLPHLLLSPQDTSAIHRHNFEEGIKENDALLRVTSRREEEKGGPSRRVL